MCIQLWREPIDLRVIQRVRLFAEICRAQELIIFRGEFLEAGIVAPVVKRLRDVALIAEYNLLLCRQFSRDTG